MPTGHGRQWGSYWCRDRDLPCAATIRHAESGEHIRAVRARCRHDQEGTGREDWQGLRGLPGLAASDCHPPFSPAVHRVCPVSASRMLIWSGPAAVTMPAGVAMAWYGETTRQRTRPVAESSFVLRCAAGVVAGCDRHKPGGPGIQRSRRAVREPPLHAAVRCADAEQHLRRRPGSATATCLLWPC